MGKGYLCSDLSEQESYLVLQGLPVIGRSNHITDLFRLVGMYEELKVNNLEEEILYYDPRVDNIFKYENAGITIIGKEIETRLKRRISRKYLKYLSRKWAPSRVKLSFDTPVIIDTLFSYIKEREILRAACIKHFSYDRENWPNIMPIQFEFLGVRLDDHRKDWDKAERIINEVGRKALH